MPLSADEQRLVDEVGETDDGRLAANVDALLTIWASRDQVYTGLARLYAKRQLIELAMGAVREEVTYQQLGVLTENDSDKFKALQTMYADTMAEIIRLEGKARGSRPGAAMELIAKTPQSPPWPSPPFPDANSKRLRGDPYRRPLFGRDSGLP